MAKRVVTVFVDDLDKTESDDVATVPFSFDGVSYEIDLAGGNRDKLAAALAPYIEAGRSVGGRRRTAKPSTAGRGPARPDRAQTQAIREWARANGHDVSDRGRISEEVRAAFQAAH